MRIFIMRAPELTPPATAAAVVLIHSITARWRGEEGAPMSERDRVPIFESKQLSLSLSRSLSVSPSEKTERRIRALSLLFFACLGSGKREREGGSITLLLFASSLSPDHLPPRHSHGKKFECFQALGLTVGGSCGGCY